MDESTDEGDGSLLSIRAKILINRCSGLVKVLEAKPELPSEKKEELLDFPRHFEYQGVLYRLIADLPQPNGGGNLHYRFLRYEPEKALSIDDIVF